MKYNSTILLWICFLCYAFTGALFIVTGIVLGEMAAYFKLTLDEMGSTFTWLNSGIWVTTILNMWLMERLLLRYQFFAASALTAAAIALFFTSTGLVTFGLGMFMMGGASGILMSTSTYMITHMYEGRQRAARLLFTDSFFSMAGTVFPILAGFLLVRGAAWQWVYVSIAAIAALTLLLTLIGNFEGLNPTERAVVKNPQATKKEPWGLAVFLIASSATAYILGQLGLMAWIPEMMRAKFALSLTEAGTIVSHFWTSYMVGMWIFSYILRLFKPAQVVIFQAGVSVVLVYLFLNSSDLTMANILIAAFGFCSSGIYTTLITIATLQTREPSPRLVNFILLCGSTGTLLTFVVTSPLMKHYGVDTTLYAMNVLYLYVFVICAVIPFISRHKHHANNDKALAS